jgi:hypothetical protein
LGKDDWEGTIVREGRLFVSVSLRLR